MELDFGWVISVSLAGIVATIGILAIINVIAGRSGYKNERKKSLINHYYLIDYNIVIQSNTIFEP